jgi:hypothetical protein
VTFAIPVGFVAIGLALGFQLRATAPSVPIYVQPAYSPPSVPIATTERQPVRAAQAPRYANTLGAIEAEQAEISGGTAKVNTEHGGYSGTGYVDGYGDGGVGSTTTFQLMAESVGEYDIYVRYANATGAPKTVSIYVNYRKVGGLTLPSLPDWESWAEARGTYLLNPGENKFSVRYDPGDSGHVNIDAIRMTPTDNPTLDEPPAVLLRTTADEDAQKRRGDRDQASTRIVDQPRGSASGGEEQTVVPGDRRKQEDGEDVERGTAPPSDPESLVFRVYHQHGAGGIVGGVIESIDRRLARKACEGDLELLEDGFRFRTVTSPDRRRDDVMVRFGEIRRVVHKGTIAGTYPRLDILRIATTQGNWEFLGDEGDIRRIGESLRGHQSEIAPSP